MNRLLDIGFRHVGNWVFNEHTLDFSLESHSTSKNVLYAFICNGEVKYIGKTTQKLKTRLSGYRNPADTQSTNIRNNRNILELLQEGIPIDIFILPDSGLLNYGGFPINLAAGLEDSLIAALDPQWNGQKTASSSTKQVKQSDLDSKNDTPSEERAIQPEHARNNHLISSLKKVTIQIKLGEAYYNRGFINIPKKHTNALGSHGEEIEFFVNNDDQPIIGYINRTDNTNKTPRLMGGKALKVWIMENFKQGDFINATFLSLHSIHLHS